MASYDGKTVREVVMVEVLHLPRLPLTVFIIFQLSLFGSEALAKSSQASPSDQSRGKNFSLSSEVSSLEKFLPAPKRQEIDSPHREDDEHTKLAWNHWNFDLCTAIQKKVEAGCQTASIRRSPELVTSATFRVSKDGQVLRVEIMQPSINRSFDSIVTDSINSMVGSELLEFPETSKREFIDVTTTHSYKECKVIIRRVPISELGEVYAHPYSGVGCSERDWENWKSQVYEVLGLYFEFISHRSSISSRQLRCVASFRITKDRKVTNVKLIKASQSIRFNSLVLECVRMLNGNMQLEFPPGSSRTSCEMTYTFENRK